MYKIIGNTTDKVFTLTVDQCKHAHRLGDEHGEGLGVISTDLGVPEYIADVAQELGNAIAKGFAPSESDTPRKIARWEALQDIDIDLKARDTANALKGMARLLGDDHILYMIDQTPDDLYTPLSNSMRTRINAEFINGFLIGRFA